MTVKASIRRRCQSNEPEIQVEATNAPCMGILLLTPDEAESLRRQLGEVLSQVESFKRERDTLNLTEALAVLNAYEHMGYDSWTWGDLAESFTSPIRHLVAWPTENPDVSIDEEDAKMIASRYIAGEPVDDIYVEVFGREILVPDLSAKS